MRDAFSSVLSEQDDRSIDRVLAAAFFGQRARDAGPAPVIALAERRAERARGPRTDR